MHNRIDSFLKLSELINVVANENAKAVCAIRESIKKSNGTLKNAICPKLDSIFRNADLKK